MTALVDPPHPPYNPNRIRVYWAPGCTSCLRTKEFLTKQGIDFDSVNVGVSSFSVQ
jgi:arsenate reductase-like glutaredoxin family protein